LGDKNKMRINRDIRAPEMRLIDQNGNMLGVKTLEEALRIAFEAGLDLVEISPNVKPVVCKITSFSKMKYEEQKKTNLNRKKQKVVETKGIKMSLNIGENDFATKIKQSIKFLEKGDKVKFSFIFRGREINYSDMAQTIIDKIIDATKEVSKVEEKPKLEGKKLFFTLTSSK
jgi:translation initiation factor IF-3